MADDLRLQGEQRARVLIDRQLRDVGWVVQDRSDLLADTITTHRRHHHPGHPATARMTQHLARIWRDCATRGHHHEP